MAKISGTTGSGMTERGVTAFDWNTPGDLDAQIAAAKERLDRSSFGRLSRRLTDQAVRILSYASLPSDPTKSYAVDDNGTWRTCEGEFASDTELGEDSLPLNQAVLLCKFDFDTPEGYAANVLMLLRQAHIQLAAGSMDEAMASAFNLGSLLTEASMKDIFEPDFLIGVKVQEGGRKAHQQTHGTREEQEARRVSYLQAFEQERAKGLSPMKAYAAVAKRFHVSVVTVRRAVKRSKDHQR